MQIKPSQVSEYPSYNIQNSEHCDDLSRQYWHNC